VSGLPPDLVERVLDTNARALFLGANRNGHAPS
jgi:hypothetical protein